MALRDILYSRPHQFRILSDITDELREAGYYTDVGYFEAQSKVHTVLCDDLGFYYFRMEEPNRKPYHVWGLTSWAPKLPAPPYGGEPEREWELGPLVPGTTMRFTLVHDAIEKGFFKIRHRRAEQITEIAGNQPVPILCYGAYQIMCWTDPIHSLIYGEGLKEWYLENQVQTRDCVILEVSSLPPDKPLVLRIFTEWERAPVASEQIAHGRTAGRRGQSILVLIWEFLEERTSAAHLTDIVSYVQKSRPEIRPVSIEACLNNNRTHFVPFGRGMWGLQEWNPGKIDIEKALGTIFEDDLVYATLSYASKPLTVDEIARRIAKDLFLEPQLLLKTNFMDVNDARFTRLSDGRWCLAENLSSVTETLTNELRREKQAVENLESQMAEQAGQMVQIKKHLDELSTERDELAAELQAVRAAGEELEQKLVQATAALQQANSRNKQQLVQFKQAISTIQEQNQRIGFLETQISESTLMSRMKRRLAGAVAQLRILFGGEP